MVNRRPLVILVVAATISLPVHADRAKDEYKHGEQAEHKANFDAASGYYKQAHTLAPQNAKYFAAYTRMRFNAATQHLHAGQLLRSTGALTEALLEFQRAVEIDSSSFIAAQELRRTAEMIHRQEHARTAPKTELPPKWEDQLGEPVELQPLSKGAITLHMTVPSDAAYKTICKLAGLNVVIDPDYRPQKITVDLTDVTLREALDMVRLQSKTFWRPVLANTIFVTADTPAKRKELEQNVMQTFYLRNLSTPAELQEAATLVRQILDVSRVQLLQAQDALVLRGTPDQMVLAAKLLSDIDKPKSEVVIDVAVMQVSRDRLRTLGMTLPTSTSAAFSPSGSSTDPTSGATSGAVTLKSLPRVFNSGNFLIGIPGGSFSYLATDSNTKILQNPSIRTLNDEKATLRIGDRVPIATGSFQPGIIGGGGVSPLVSTQFQYLDVGVNIDITPHIHANGEVTLKMSLEISSVTGQTTIGGITQPVIGQRRIEHETRLKDGDVNLLGGILEETETQSLSGYPWVSKIPILKYLFAQENKDHREDEIVFAITPHIVRGQDITDENTSVTEVGTGNSIELRPRPSAAASAEPAPAGTDPQPPAPEAPATAAPAQAAPPTKPGATR